MFYLGRVKNGVIQLDTPVELPEGQLVRIEPMPTTDADPFDSLGEDAIETGIPDLSEQHDHYASGAPKRPKSPR